MITMILCWALWTRAIIGLTLPILATICSAFELASIAIKIGMKIHNFSKR